MCKIIEILKKKTETEIYNVMTDQWSVVSQLPHPHSEGGCEFYDEKIYIVSYIV